MQSLLLILVLVPAPKELPPPFPVGDWQVEWGTVKQGMSFHPDGTYSSIEYGTGFWSTDGEGAVWFSEQGDRNHYAMTVNPRCCTGTGWIHSRDNGSYHSELKVKMVRKKGN